MVFIAGGIANQFLKTRRTMAKDTSDIKQERSNVVAGTFMNESLMLMVTRAEERTAETIKAAREIYAQREAHIERIARLDEQLKNCQREMEACQDRAQRAETRAAAAEEHMREQTEQMLMMGINIDRLTTALARHDAAEAAQLSPKKTAQPLLVIQPDTDGTDGP